MEREPAKILDLNGREFALAVERERKNLVQVPAFDLDGWLSRKPTGSEYGDQRHESPQKAEEAWLYDSGLPLEVFLWNILVEPRQPKQMSVGGILIPDETIAAENFKTNIGRIVHMGSAAWKSKTEGGVLLSDYKHPQVGDVIVHRHFTGLEMIIGDTGKRLRIMDDTDVIGRVRDPDQWRMYL